jgi:ATP-binding cassette, subfamily B, bacterial PglK
MVKSFRRMWSLLSVNERSRAVAVLLATFAGALLETAGVAAVPVFVGLLSRPEASSPVRTFLLRVTGAVSNEQIAIWGGGLLFVLFVAKNAYGAWLLSVQGAFAHRCFVSFSTRLLDRYLRAPYTFHLGRNSAELLRNTNQEANTAVQNVLLPAMLLVTECLVAFCIVALVVSIEPAISIVAFVLLAGAGASFWLLIRQRSRVLGERQLVARRWMIQAVTEALGGIKEVKVLRREAFFLSAYRRSVEEFAVAATYNRLVGQLPRPFIETVAIAGLLLVGAVFLWQGRPIATIVETLAFFAIAVLRLMPSAQRIMASLSNLRFNVPSLDVLAKELGGHLELDDIDEVPAQPPATAPHPRSFANSIEIRDVAFAYPSHEREVLSQVSLTIPTHCMVGFVGPSGSGKSTLMDVILGLLPPSDGAVLVDGVDIHTLAGRRWWVRQIGYIPQFIFLADATILRNVAFGLEEADIVEADVWAALEAAQLADFVRSLPDGLHTHVGERGIRISGGQRQRIGIARALYHRPSVLIMDEATSALDSETERDFVRAIEDLRSGTTILVVAHRLSTIQSCDLIVVVESGRIVDQGGFAELRERGSIGEATSSRSMRPVAQEIGALGRS